MASTAAAPRHLTYREARERVLGAVQRLPSEIVPLAEARGRALSRAILAPYSLPPFRNSSMDGYAVRSDDVVSASPSLPVVLPVVLVLAAGRVAARALRPGESMRIMTGAELPEGADAVVPFEDAERIAPIGMEEQRIGPPGAPGAEAAGERVRFLRPPPAGANVREAGADLGAGEVALAAGRELSPHDLALLASLGIGRIEVGRQPRLALLSTGDELLGLDEPLRPGSIRDSNLPLLEALLGECGCLVVRSERAGDDPFDVARRIRESLGLADAVLSIGGVSAGDFDPVKLSLVAAKAELWRVAMKPGRPQAFGVSEGRMFYGLPGNPASVACVFEALVRPALRKMQGFTSLDRPRLEARAATAIESRPGRIDFVRATLSWRDGDWWASPAGVQVSGHLTPQSRAHALLVVPEECAGLGEGDRAEAMLLRWPDA